MSQPLQNHLLHTRLPYLWLKGPWRFYRDDRTITTTMIIASHNDSHNRLQERCRCLSRFLPHVPHPFRHPLF